MSVCLEHSAHARRLISAAAASVTAALVASLLSCGSSSPATDVAATPTCRSGESPPSVAQGLLLTTIVGDGAQGTPLTSTVPYDQGAVVPYCYAPSAGNASALAVLDGSVVPASGSIAMTADHVLWAFGNPTSGTRRSEEHTSELQSPCNLVCRLLLEKKKKKKKKSNIDKKSYVREATLRLR